MVARSSVARASGYHYILRSVPFFLSPYFLRRRKTDIHETFPHDVA